MSQFIGAAEPNAILSWKDLRLVPSYQVIRRERDHIVDRYAATEYPGGYTNAFWPGGAGLQGDSATDVAIMQAIWRGPITRFGWGAASRVGFNGVARDQYGAPLAGVTCSLFRVSDRQWIQDTVSRSGGTFTLVSWYSPDTHFIVFYKAGSPNVFGTSDQNLVGV